MKNIPKLKRPTLKKAALLCIFAQMLIALLVLGGWHFNIQRLKYPITGLVGMNPVTAITFIVLGVSFLLFFSGSNKARGYIGSILAIIVIAASVFKLLTFYFHQLPPIDKLFYSDQIVMRDSGGANSMAFTTAISFVLSGLAVLLINKETKSKRLPAHYLAMVVMAFSLFTLLGYLYGAPEFVNFVKRFPMAVHTAGCFLLISLAILFAHPQKGITREFTSTVTGNLLGRSLFFGAIVIPVLLGELRIYFIRKEVFSTELGVTFLVVAIIFIFCLLTFYFLLRVNQIDVLRSRAENRLRKSEETFRSLVSNVKDYAIFRLDTLGNVVTWNKGAEAIKGYTADEIKGENISVFYTAEDREKDIPATLLKKAKENGQYETEGWRVRKDGSKFWADVVITSLYDDNNVLTGYAKVTRDITESKKAKDQLNTFNEELKKQVDEKTSELQDTTSQLRQLAAYLQTAREDERKSIAREIHDELGQMLTGIKMDMVWLRKKIMPANEDISKRFDEALELINETKQSMRRISQDLHPAVLSDLGLLPALNLLFRDFENRSGITINFTSGMDEEEEMNVSPEVSIALYRICQESLNNIAKHSEAEKVTASLHKEDNLLVLEVHDNGRGFDLNDLPRKKTLGLVSIRERVIMINGAFRIDTSPGKGTNVRVSVPVNLK